MANLEKSASFSFIKSYSLTTEIGVKLCSLEGEFLSASDIRKEVLEKYDMKFSGMHQSKRPDLMAMLRVYADGKELCLPTSSSYKAFTNQWNWSEYIKLPINYSDLPRNALLAITLYDCVGATELRAVGGTTLPLFGKRGLYRRGLMDLRVWPLTEADGSPTNNLTPGKMNDKSSKMYHLRKLVKQYQEGLLPPVEWLDRLTFREIEVIKKREKSDSPYLYLTVEFPEVTMNDMSFHVVYYEEEDDDVIPCKTQGEIVTIPDTEIGLDNLVERKHHILSRSVRSGISDKDAKPNAAVRDQLNNIVGYPPTKQLTTEEQDLIWKFRFYLSNQKKASVKFLECVNWKLPAEVKQALDLLAEWAPMGVEDALGLLGPKFQHPAVRRYAVTRLKQASDEDLLLYLLQLVQALKYENFEDINKKYKHLDELISSKDNGVAESLPSTSSESSSSGVSTNAGHNNEVMQYYKTIFDTNTDMDLATFLIYRACGNFNLANYFYWYLMVECEDCESSTVKQDSSIKNMYLTVRKTFLLSLRHGSAEMQKKAAYLKQQKTFVTMLMQLVKNVARENGNRKKKIEHLRSLLKENDPSKFNFSNFDPLPFPLDPTVHIKGIVPEKATLFNSHLMPSKLTFLSTNYKEYVTIFKNGDDLRQDQLVLQIITLMDKLLRSENLDLKLTPYRVLAVSIKHGFVQFVESVPVAEVLATCGTIQNFFRKYHPSENGSYGISPDIMDTYVKSCAGYCVITYLLGVGDRHFDNLLLTTTGKLFHIDFGYILGRDPKPLPPPMKLSKEMVEAMGGVNSEHYNEFRKLCYVAFLHLRRHSNLILNLFTLMVNANVPDIALEPDKAVMKVQEKFRLDLGDEEAVHYFQNLLDMSVTAVMAALVEQLHKFAQYWRNS